MNNDGHSDNRLGGHGGAAHGHGHRCWSLVSGHWSLSKWEDNEIAIILETCFREKESVWLVMIPIYDSY